MQTQYCIEYISNVALPYERELNKLEQFCIYPSHMNLWISGYDAIYTIQSNMHLSKWWRSILNNMLSISVIWLKFMKATVNLSLKFKSFWTIIVAYICATPNNLRHG